MSKSKKNIFVPMVADLFHWGHVKFLKEIRKKYPKENIIIGLITDDVCASYKRKPIMNYDERKIVLESCKYVDKVINFSKLEITMDFLKKNNLDLVVHAHNKEEHEKYSIFWKNIQNNFVRMDYNNGISTTDIIKRVKDRI